MLSPGPTVALDGPVQSSVDLYKSTSKRIQGNSNLKICRTSGFGDPFETGFEGGAGIDRDAWDLSDPSRVAAVHLLLLVLKSNEALDGSDRHHRTADDQHDTQHQTCTHLYTHHRLCTTYNTNVDSSMGRGTIL